MLLLFFPCCQGQKYHSKFFIQVFIVRFNIETRLAFCAISYLTETGKYTLAKNEMRFRNKKPKAFISKQSPIIWN